MKRKVSVLVVTLLLVFAVFGAVNARRGPATVPFKVSCVTHPVIVEMYDDHFVLEIPSECQGTHLGKSEWHADSVVDISAPPPPFPQTGEMIFTAANGDKLIGTFSGLGLPDGLGGNSYWGDYVITRGTGRFKGTKGSGTYYGAADGVIGTAVFKGTLTKP